LDGIRGIAALTVVMFHGISERFPGGQAVEMFFVLSGFLITWLLLSEERRTGTVALRSFYARRAFRLFPAIIALLAWELVVDRPHVSHQSIAAVACYVANYYSAFGGQLGPLTHTWSLAVEEHFYLVWPAVLVFTTNRNRLLKCVLAAALVSVVDRFVTAVWVSAKYPLNATDANASALLCGCAMALLIWTSRRAIPAALFHPVIATLALGGSAVLGQLPKTQYVWAILGVPLHAIILLQAVTYGWRILENRAAYFLGRVSYGVYVWQFVAIWLVRHMHLETGPVSWIAIPAAAVLFAAISHYAIERPAQSVGRRLLARLETRPSKPENLLCAPRH
jgi:peptidoglycan/LPS O-acetylase OafA/YrhL